MVSIVVTSFGGSALTAGLIAALLALAACGSDSAVEQVTPGASGCGVYESWGVNPDFANPKGVGITPRAAVKSLGVEQLEILGVDRTDGGMRLVSVSRNGVAGVYETTSHRGQWTVIGGKGCGAAGGAPLADSEGCPPPENMEMGEETMTICSVDGPIEPEFYYPTD